MQITKVILSSKINQAGCKNAYQKCLYPAVALDSIATYVAPLDKWLKTEIWSGIQGLFECSNGGR